MTKTMLIAGALAAAALIGGCHRNSYVDRTRAPGVDGPKERHPDAPEEKRPEQPNQNDPSRG